MRRVGCDVYVSECVCCWCVVLCCCCVLCCCLLCLLQCSGSSVLLVVCLFCFFGGLGTTCYDVCFKFESIIVVLAQGWVCFHFTMVRRAHEGTVASWRAVPLHHCSSPECFRFANAPRWRTCCWQCAHCGSGYHTWSCPVRQVNTVRTLVESQALLETILAQMDELPPVR